MVLPNPVIPAPVASDASADVVLAPERPEDAAAAARLIEEAFGPGRFAKAVERLREQAALERACSFVAWREGVACGCVRLWSIEVGGRPGLLLGPIAVAPDERRHGLGARLVERACEAARARGWSWILLVGDPPFFGPQGFVATPAGRIALPGPVDPRRVLVRALCAGGADDLRGPVRPLV